MSQSHENLEQLLERVASGAVDGFSESDIAAVEQALLADAALAERFAHAKPPVDLLLQTPAAKPTVSEWSHVWSGIEHRRAMPTQEARGHGLRIFAVWRAGAAVAACVGLFAIWRALPDSSGGGGMQLASSSNVEILDMEVFGGRSATLHFADDGSGAVIISISDPEVDDLGAS